MSLTVWIVFYTVLVTLLYFLLKYNRALILNNHRGKNIELGVFLSSFIIFLICAFRDVELGSDYKTYVAMYEYTKNYGGIHPYLIGRGPLLGFLINVSASVGLGYNFFFGVVGALIFYVFIRSAGDEKKLLPIMFLMFAFDGFLLWSQSGIRQALSIVIFLYSIQYIIKGDFFKYSLLLVVGSGFHFSVIFFLPIYFVRYFKFNKNIVFLFMFLALTGFLEKLLVDVILKVSQIVISNISFLSHYAQYASLERFQGGEIQTGSGLGFYFRIAYSVFLAWVGNTLITRSSNVQVYLNLYFIGFIISLTFPYSELVTRTMLYLKMTLPILTAYLFCLHFRLNNKIFISGFLFVYYLVFLTQINDLHYNFYLG